MNKYEQFYINGEWVNPVNKLKTLDVINPATEDVIGTIAMGDSDDVDAAVKAAKNAFETFGQTTTEDTGIENQVFQDIPEGLVRRATAETTCVATDHDAT